MDQRFDRIDQRLDRTDERVNGLEQRVDGLESRLDHIDSVQSTMALRLITVETVLNQHSVLLQSLVVRMDSLHGLVEELERRTGRIEQEYVMITEALRRLEKRFDQIEAQRLNERNRGPGSKAARIGNCPTLMPKKARRQLLPRFP
jgi:chromosome segregation ATPase